MLDDGVYVAEGDLEGVTASCSNGVLRGPSDRRGAGEKGGSLFRASVPWQFLQATLESVFIVGRRSIFSG